MAKRLMEKYLAILVLILLSIFTFDFWHPNPALGEDGPQSNQTLPSFQPIQTQSRFTDKLEEETKIIPKTTLYQDDPETEAGEEKVLQEGENGKVVTIVKVTYAEGEEYSREIVSTETTPAIDKKILRGTKIVWKSLDAPEGEIKYWKKMRVYATHYDSRCFGCNGWTAIGMRAGKGVVAVDPKVIPLRSKAYIPGYGMAVAGDTGGAIKGKIIDLGFDDARTAGWRAKFIDIYLL